MDWSALLAALGPVFNWLGIRSTNRTNTANVQATNTTNKEIQDSVNSLNAQLAANANALNWKMFNVGNSFAAGEALKERQFNAQQAQIAREYASAPQALSRLLAAGVNPETFSGEGQPLVASSSASPSALGGLGATAGAPAQAARMQAPQNIAPNFDTLGGLANLLEVQRKNTADIERDMRDSKSKEVQADAAKVSAAANASNADTAKGALEVQKDVASHQNAVFDAQSKVATQDALLKEYEAKNFYTILQHKFDMDERQATAAQQQASAALGAVSAQIKSIIMNDKLQRDLSKNTLDQQERLTLRQLNDNLAIQKRNYEAVLKGLGLEAAKIQGSWNQFQQEFDAQHGGIINKTLDFFGVSKLGSAIGGAAGAYLGKKF